MRFLRELRNHLTGFAASLRQRRAYGDLLKVEIGQDIAADVQAVTAKAGGHAYSAEQAALEATRLFRAAQLPDSPGGRHITRGEAAAAFRHLRNSHRHTHAVCHLLANP